MAPRGPVKPHALDPLHQRVDGFRSGVGEPVASVVGQHLGLPAADGLGQPAALGAVSGRGVVVVVVELVERVTDLTFTHFAERHWLS